MILNFMWMRYYPLLNGILETTIDFWKSFTTFCRWPKWTILFSFQWPLFHSIITDFMVSNTKWWAKFCRIPFLLIENGEDICSPTWVAVVMTGSVAVNLTRTEYWYPFFSKSTWLCIFGDIVSEYKHFALDKHCELKYASLIPLNEQLSASSPWFKN